MKLLRINYYDNIQHLEIFSNLGKYPARISINDSKNYLLTPEEIGKIIVTLAKVLAEHHVE